MFRNRSDLITAIIIYGILGQCERVCKKFEWTKKKWNEPTDASCPAMLSSPSSPRQRADRLHFMVCGTTRWKHKTRFGETTQPPPPSTPTTIYYYCCARMMGARVQGGFFVFLLHAKPPTWSTRRVHYGNNNIRYIIILSRRYQKQQRHRPFDSAATQKSNKFKL